MTETSSNILTEVGTNELEVVEFLVGGRPYAINVGKVREIIRPEKPMAIPASHPHVLGVFRNREDVVPLIDLGRWLGAEPPSDHQRSKIIVAEFNRMKVGFLVHGVNRIHRVSWADLESPREDSMLESRSSVGFLRLGKGSPEGERIVFLLDFERMVAEIRPNREICREKGDEEQRKRRAGKVVLVAEDSSLIRKMLKQTLEGGGYSVLISHDGQDAWDKLAGGAHIDALISDIEMPRMDGHHLTRRVKSDERLGDLPVILYSSMISEEIRRKGSALGADAQICKPDLVNLVTTVDQLLFGGTKGSS